MATVPAMSTTTDTAAPSFFEKYKIPLLVGGAVLVIMLLKHQKDKADETDAKSAAVANMVVPNRRNPTGAT